MRFELNPTGKKVQDIYHANMDYEATLEKMKNLHSNRRPVRVGGGRPPAESHIIIEINDSLEASIKRTEDFLKRMGTNPADARAHAERSRRVGGATILISRYGKIQISYRNVEERNLSLEFLRDNLVPVTGEGLNLDPISLNPFYRNPYLKMQKEIANFFDELYGVRRSWEPYANERALSEPFPTSTEILEKSLQFLKMLILKLVKDGVKEMLHGERSIAQIESEYMGFMQGIVYELVGEAMATCFHLEKIQRARNRASHTR